MAEVKENKFEKYTTSLCPTCMKKIPMRIFEKNGVVYLDKTCDDHGKFEDIYWGDADLFNLYYKKWMDASYVGQGLDNRHTDIKNDCPFDCGLCPQHKTPTILGIIDITNRCNMSCPICFAYAGAANYVYEPEYDQILGMINLFRLNKPWACNALQFSGGEPTLRNDLPDLIKEAKKAGIEHVEVNSNGLRLSEDINYFKKIYEAGMNTLYLQFDGLREETYKKLRGKIDLVPIKEKVIENARKIGLSSIVLVFTLAKNVNDNDLGQVIDFAKKNSDVVRCINIQPISMAGRAKNEGMRELRITIPDAMKLLEEQTSGLISRSDWRPVNWPVPIAKGMGITKNRIYPEFTINPMCGAATFIIKNNDESWVPITKVVDVDKFAEIFWKTYYLGLGGSRNRAKLELVKLLPMIKVDFVRNLIKNVIFKGSYEALGEFMRKIIMIGIMHFQDPWNIDLNRVQMCGIHYATPDGKLRSFCTYNSIYRREVEKKFQIPIAAWMEKTGKKISEPV